jgi:hypothetical protein
MDNDYKAALDDYCLIEFVDGVNGQVALEEEHPANFKLRIDLTYPIHSIFLRVNQL